MDLFPKTRSPSQIEPARRGGSTAQDGIEPHKAAEGTHTRPVTCPGPLLMGKRVDIGVV